MLSEDALIIIIAVESSAAVLIALLFFIIGFYCGHLCLKNRKRRAFFSLPKPIPRPRLKESYYNMPPSGQDNIELRLEQKHVLQTKQDCPAVMYDDVTTSSNQDPNLPEKSSRHVVTYYYDDVLSPREQDLKGQKPKVMYDEVLPPHEQDGTCVELKKNTAYRPADSK